jgi:pyruvate dehydrogenase E1 component alpha subunit
MLAKEKMIRMFVLMCTIRYFEEKVKDLFKRTLVRGPLHLYIGEEAVAVGACSTLGDGDYITSTHRGHGHCIAKGADLNCMMAELMGKETGYCRGRGGSMHICDPDLGILGADGIVGGGIPIAVGAGFSSQYRNDRRVTLCFFGDGASNQGTFHESLNLASLWKLPVVFICENNLYAITTPSSRSLSVPDVATRAVGYGIPGTIIDGNNVMEVHQVVAQAVENAREGKGPALIECKTYRHEGHWLGDPIIYRTQEEVNEWKKKDPIKSFENVLVKDRILSAEQAEQIHRETKEQINRAEKFGDESPFPSVETIEEGI